MQKKSKISMDYRCPNCFLLMSASTCRFCRGPTILSFLKGGKELVVGHIGRLEHLTQNPETALEAACSGPRRWPRRNSHGRARTACRQHGRNTIWLWTCQAHKIPDIYEATAPPPGEHKAIAKLYRKLESADGLLIEVPPKTRRFKSAYEHFRSRACETHETGQLMPTMIARLENLAVKGFLKPNYVALVHSARDFGRPNLWIERIQRWPSRPKVFVASSAIDGLHSLVRKSSNRSHIPSDAGKSKKKGTRGDVDIVDLGGTWGHNLLFRMHLASHLSIDRRTTLPKVEKDEVLAVSYPLRQRKIAHILSQVSLEGALLNNKSLFWSKVAAMAHGVCNNGGEREWSNLAKAFRSIPRVPWGVHGPVAPWTGLFLTWPLLRRFSAGFYLVEHPDVSDPAAVLLVAVGADRRQGEVRLIELIETRSTSYQTVLVGRNDASDEKLLDWVTQSFPHSRMIKLNDNILKSVSEFARIIPESLRTFWDIAPWN